MGYRICGMRFGLLDLFRFATIVLSCQKPIRALLIGAIQEEHIGVRRNWLNSRGCPTWAKADADWISFPASRRTFTGWARAARRRGSGAWLRRPCAPSPTA